MQHTTIGIIGGTGALGGAIARALLRGGYENDLWIASRTGTADALRPGDRLRVTTDSQELVAASDLVLLAVPPASAVALNIDATGKLVVSVMAGVTAAALHELTGTEKVVRAMCNPAADRGLAYAPWWASPAVTDEDRARVRDLFTACGTTDEVPAEDQIDLFTALTGPAPGFVAYLAQCMADYATTRGVAPEIAERAVKQLFLASGTILAESERPCAAHVQEMIDYAGTTAAGLLRMGETSIAAGIAEGLDAAQDRAKTIAG